jgi:hypothetical protein
MYLGVRTISRTYMYMYEGETWTSTTPGVVVSSEQNPGPLLWKNGSMNMWCVTIIMSVH